MVVGFNHNFRYKGELYHVQTEDGGLKSPNIVTLLYCGGTILASQKTSYADITKVDNLEQVVEELMKEQHKEMLRRLKDGEFDERLQGHQPIVNPAVTPSPDAGDLSQPVAPPAATPAPPTVPRAATPKPVAEVFPKAAAPAAAGSGGVPPVKAPAKPAGEQPAPRPAAEPVEAAEAAEPALDDIILSYLVGDDD